MMKRIRKLAIMLLSVITAASFCFVMAAFADGGVTERTDVKYVKADQTDGTAIKVYFDLGSERTGNGTNVNNLDGVGNYIYYNGKTCLNSCFDVHMRSNMFYFYAKAGTTLTAGDEITFVKSLHFPVVTDDGVAVTEYKDYLSETVVLKYTESGWVNQTELNKAAEQQVTVTGLGVAVGNGETFKTNDTLTTNEQNYTNTEDWAEVKGYILYNGAAVGSQFDVHMMSGNFYVYPNNYDFALGDTITILEGLHMPANAEAHWGSTPTYADQKYAGYIAESYTIEKTEAGWVKQAAVGEKNTLKTITVVSEVAAGATMPATYKFTINFELKVSATELTDLQSDANYAGNIYIKDKSVSAWNSSVTAQDNDGETIPAITVSAYGTGITLTLVKDSGILDGTSDFGITVKKEFVCSTGNTIAENIVRYYINDLTYWSTLAPYEIEKTTALNIGSIVAFEVIDGGVNGAIVIIFNENIASKQLLAYNFHPEYLKTLPNGYPVDLADNFASSGSTLNFINHVMINGKTMADYWKDLSGAEAKSSLFQCHILTTNSLRIGSAVSNGFDGNSPITIVLKKGLEFYNGAYLDYDITVTYTPALGETAASTTYSIATETVTLACDKTQIDIGGTAQLTANVNPTSATGAVEYVSSDTSVATVDENGVVTAVKAGTAKITAKVGDVTSTEITITVKAAQTSTSETVSSSESISESNKKTGCLSDMTTSAAVLGISAFIVSMFVLIKRKESDKQ